MNGARREPWDCCLVIDTKIDIQSIKHTIKRKQNVISGSKFCPTGNAKMDEELTRMSDIDKKYVFASKMNRSNSAKFPPSVKGPVK